MQNIQKILRAFVAYLFTLLLIRELVELNPSEKLIFASLGFILVIHIIPLIMDFFKMREDHVLQFLLIGLIVNTVYGFIIKSGVVGLIYYPPTAVIGDIQNKTSLLHLELPESGIIVVISFISILLFTLINKKFK